jgi:hypothetical protein
LKKNKGELRKKESNIGEKKKKNWRKLGKNDKMQKKKRGMHCRLLL